MTTNTKKLFQEISQPQDKARILTQISQDQTDIVTRIRVGAEFYTQARIWTPPFRLEVSTPDVKLDLHPLIVQFDSKEERYFSKVQLSFDDWKVYYLFFDPIFRLQRRQHQRLKIPQKIKNRVFIMRVNEAVWNEDCEMIDISQGGCSLRTSYRSLEMPHQAVLLLDIQIGGRPPFLQIATICYKRAEKYQGRSVVRVGLKFHPHPKTDAQVKDLVQNLAFEVFSQSLKKS